VYNWRSLKTNCYRARSTVDDTRLNFGGLTVLKARMNQDLRMADKLKATGASNLFVVFGEPDIEIKPLPGEMLQVKIRGMDIFDPTTGEVRSSGGKELLNDVAAWFVDHDYDEESFFVRQAYFVGGDPYDGLKRALKAEIDETAWAELNSTVFRGDIQRQNRGNRRSAARCRVLETRPVDAGSIRDARSQSRFAQRCIRRFV
jgi:hypothetical protein